MNIYREAEQRFVGQMLFPLTNTLFNRRGILSNYNSLLRTQSASQDELQDLQLRRLRYLIEYAGRYVPYYRNLFASIGLAPGDFKTLDDLRLIPPLTRADVVENRLNLVDERWRAVAEACDRAPRPPGEPLPFARFRGKQLIRNTSSGSTGAPTIFYEDGSITSCNWANELRLRQWFGVSPGARESRMARVSADYIRNSKAVNFRRWIWNQLLLPGVSLSEPEFVNCALELGKFQPEVLWGFTSAAAGLAGHIKSHSELYPNKTIRVVITWAAPLYAHEKQLIQEAFGCDVTNIYGTRETGHIAARCPQGGLHVNQESHYLETEVMDFGTERGELLVTPLTPTPMPFIRYRTGDIGVLGTDRCTCGRTLQLLQEFTGRTGEIFVTRDGRMISPNFWCRTFMDTKLGTAVQRFQIIYRPEDTITIRIVRGPEYSQRTEDHLRGCVTRNLMKSAQIEFEYPERIDAQVSGKYQMVINEANHQAPVGRNSND